MRALHPGVAGRSDAELLALGDQACAGFRRDDGYDTVVAGLRQHGLSQGDAVGVIVSATIADDKLCADMNERVRKDLLNGATPYPART